MAEMLTIVVDADLREDLKRVELLCREQAHGYLAGSPPYREWHARGDRLASLLSPAASLSIEVRP